MVNTIFEKNQRSDTKISFQNVHASSYLVLASERTKSRNHFVVIQIDFDGLMTPEGTENLIFAFSSKTGQSATVEHQTQKLSFFFSCGERIYEGI